MRATIAIFLLFAAVFFLWFDYLPLSVLCILIAAYALLHKPVKSLGKEFMKDMESAEGQAPSGEVFVEGVKVAGARAGEQLFADKDETTRLKALRATRFKLRPDKIGEASKKTIELFKKLFG